MSWIISVALVALAVLFTVALASARGPHPNSPPGPDRLTACPRGCGGPAGYCSCDE